MTVLRQSQPASWLSWMHIRLVIMRCGFDHHQVGNILSWRFDHEIFSTVILSLPLIQEGQLSVFWQKNVHNTGRLLRGLSLPSKCVVM